MYGRASGGTSSWLKVAEQLRHYGVPICSHGMQELHVSLASAQCNADWLEVRSFPIDQYTTRPLVLHHQLAAASDDPDNGVTFDWANLEPYEVYV